MATTEVETITPEEARDYLKANTKNRFLDRNKAQIYAGAIARGEWSLNGETIKFTKRGRLLDGQHRLLGVVLAGKSIKSAVVRGLDDKAQETIDTGRKRSFGDVLKLRGESNTRILASGTRCVYGYSKNGVLTTSSHGVRPTMQQLITFLDENPGLRKAVNFPYSDVTRKLLTPAVGCGLFYLFSLVDEEDAHKFFVDLGTGVGLDEENPVLALRNRLLKETGIGVHSMHPRIRAALTIKAFNAWRDGRHLKVLKWSAAGNLSENFPRVHGCPIIPEVDG